MANANTANRRMVIDYTPLNLGVKCSAAPIVNMIHEEIRKYVAEPAVIEKFSNMGLTPIASSPSQFSDFIKEETKRWPQLIRELNITVD
jgi:tripartite-type tricarboxylate transporter receptor subunit TctC